jgi:hypothetical protein
MTVAAGLFHKILEYQLPKGIKLAFYLVFAFFPLLIVGLGYHQETGFTSLIYFGSDFQTVQLSKIQNIPKTIYQGSGYDGQAYAQLAIDPLLIDPQLASALDNPQYRARRILIPALSFLIGLGQPAWILESYALINLGFYWLLIYILYQYLRPQTTQSFLGFTAIVTTTGIVASLSRALVDLPAAVFLLLAVIPSSASLGPLFLLLAVLSKDASIIALPLVLFPNSFHRFAILRSLLKMAWVILPVTAWLVYVSRRLPQGEFTGYQSFALPFGSIISHLVEMLAIFRQTGSLESAAEIIVTLTLLFQGGYLFYKPRLNSSFWRVGVAFLFLFLCLGPSVMEEQLAYTRAVLPLTLIFNLLIIEERSMRFLFWFTAGNAGLYLGLVAAFLKMVR